VTEVAEYLRVTVAHVYRLAYRRHWRTVRVSGYREVYYLIADVRATPRPEDRKGA
jgi:excisionase family DNA binding protein